MELRASASRWWNRAPTKRRWHAAGAAARSGCCALARSFLERATTRVDRGALAPRFAAPPSPPWQLTCVGSLTRSPHTVEFLRSQLERSAVAGRVTFVGEVSDDALEELYRDTDLFVLPTQASRATACRPSPKALARGLPVISTHTGAIPELVGTTAGLLWWRPALWWGCAVFGAGAGTERTGIARRAGARGHAAVRATLPGWSQACEHMSRVLRDAHGRVRTTNAGNGSVMHQICGSSLMAWQRNLREVKFNISIGGEVVESGSDDGTLA